MRSTYPMKLIGACLLLCGLSINVSAQYFDNYSNNLPDASASFQTKEVLATDVDNDGDIDIILANEFQRNVVLLNNGQGVFTEGQVGIPANEEHDSEGITVGDFNQDGLNDIVFVSEDDFEHEYYWNNGNGTYNTPPIFLPYTVCRTVLAHDFNSDGVDDLILGNNGQNMMLINNGAGDFANETFERIPFFEDATQDIDIADVNGDGKIDMFVANENGNHLLINNGFDVFIDETANKLPQGLVMDSRSMLFGDVDGDGDQDIFLCNVAFADGADARNRLFLNDGQGNFSDVSANNLPAYTEQTVDAVFTDFNNDGSPDIIVTNVLGIPMGAYVNNGNGKFNDVTNVVLGNLAVEAFGIAAADFNNDGFEDLYIGNREGKDVLMLRNPAVLSSEELPIVALSVRPNPVRSTVQIQGEWTEAPKDVMVFDTQGRRVINITNADLNGDNLSFEMPQSVADGVYTIRIQTKKSIGTAKIVLLR